MSVDNILLGDGVFSINGVDVGLTRGGGTFSIEREYRQIEADGDYGPVKGRVKKIKSTAKLKLNALELLPANLVDFYPAMNLNTSGVGSDVLTAALDVVSGDYSTVTFTGTTKAGKQVIIEIQNAINLEAIEWALVDKEEVVPELTFTAAYLESARTTEPWSISFAKGTVYTVTYTVTASSTPIEGASVTFHGETKLTNASGVAEFTGVVAGNNQPYTVIAGGYNNIEASINVDGNESVAVALTTV